MIHRFLSLLHKIYLKLIRTIILQRERACELLSVITIKWKKVILVGTPTHSNIGDSAIVIAEHHFLNNCGFSKRHILELSVSAYERRKDRVLSMLRKNPSILVCLHGGGNMGDQWPKEETFRRAVLTELPVRSILLFPQTIFYSDTKAGKAFEQDSIKVYDSRHDLTIVAREQTSFQIIKTLYPNTKSMIAPDIVLSETLDQFGVSPAKRNGVLLCLRTDPEKSVSEETWKSLESYLNKKKLRHYRSDMYSPCIVTPQNRKKVVRTKMKEFSKADLVITDRLHGMVFAAITGTPCIVFSNYNHKVFGTYEWIQYLPYIHFSESLEDAERFIPELLDLHGGTFDNTPLLPFFEQLKAAIIALS